MVLNAHTAVQEALRRVSAELEALVAALSEQAAWDAAATVHSVEAVGRLTDAARVLAAAPLAEDPAAAERLGYASPVAAVATLTQISERSARARLALAEAVTPGRSLTGAPVPPRHPEVAGALTSGRLGLEAAALITRELDRSAPRVAPEARAVAEQMMVNLACGLDPSGEQQLAPISVDFLTNDVRTLGAAIDPDGARPREQRAAQNRSVWVGAPDDDGLMPIHGALDPVLGNLLVRLLEAWRRSPRFVDTAELDAPSGEDSRTPAQRRHDASGEVLIAAAAAEGTPQLNGHPVTVLGTVTADDLNRPDGLDADPIASLAGSPFPLSRGEVDRLIDANGFRTVSLTAEGAVAGISSPERCFTANQTLSIAARDGYRCSTPGCSTPHTALQVHHVTPWREGGPTSTSNGILLCYWHHRRVDDGPWQYRMVRGVPEVRGPGIPEWRRLHPDLARAA
ncbi:HNH endonuclease signature motif containing protein [soil metagenome]